MKKRLFGDWALTVATASAALVILVILGVIVFDVAVHGWPKLTFGFLVEEPKDGMTAGGIFPAIFGTAALVILMTIAALPVGVATAIYLAEYAPPDSRFAKLVRLAVQNLAGVPSIVFGLFGLGFFIQFVGKGIDGAFYGGEKVFGQPGLLWAALTMAVLTLPVVIVVTEEALRAVPNRLRDAAYALGATRFQVVTTVVVPEALGGILTGAILAVNRGAGEVAPILFTGAAYFLPELPHGLSSQFMHLGYHVYVLSTQSPDVEATTPILYATVAVLLALVFVLSSSAVFLRARIRRRAA
ncbi:phosphate ABC transporter permease PstA [Myxococcota bacterium]|nr:phosphate ABC transporter permease PstA [Myxococcota bacterium]